MKNFISTLFILMLFQACSPFIRVRCGDNKSDIRLIPKENPFSVYEEKKERKITAIIDSISLIINSPKLSIENKRELTQKMEELNQPNIRYRFSLIALYEPHRSDPCSSEKYQNYKEGVQKIEKDEIELEKLRLTIEKIKKSSGIGGFNAREVSNAIEKYINSISKK